MSDVEILEKELKRLEDYRKIVDKEILNVRQKLQIVKMASYEEEMKGK